MEGRVLPILEIPEEIVKAVLEENQNPLGNVILERLYLYFLMHYIDSSH